MKRLYALVVVELVLAIIIFSISSVYGEPLQEDISIYENDMEIIEENDQTNADYSFDELLSLQGYQFSLFSLEDDTSDDNSGDTSGDTSSKKVLEEKIKIVDEKIEVDKESANKKEDENSKLKVNISNEKGEGILLKSGEVLYTAESLVFTPVCEQTASYSLSIDGGKSFGAYVKLNDKSLLLCPDYTLSPDGSFQIRFKICKESGEEGEKQNIEEVSEIIRVKFDNRAPMLEVLNKEVLENWLSKEDILRLKITDDNLLSRIMASIDGKTVSEWHFASEDKLSEKEIELKLDQPSRDEKGVAICLSVYDMAGNASSITYNYYLDTEKPTIYMLDPSQAILKNEDGKNELHIGVRDDCPRSTYLSYEISRIYNGMETIENILLNSSDIAGSLTLPLDEDGRYHVTARAFDMAGNTSNDISLDFMVDKQAPQISIEGVNAGGDIKGSAQVRISISDSSYENGSARIIITRSRGSESVTLKDAEYKLEGNIDSRLISLENDGDYTISVIARDGAGQTSESSASFRIDATAPLIRISGLNEKEITNTKPVIRMSAQETFFNSTILSYSLSKKDKSGQYLPVSEDMYVMKDRLDYKDITINDEGEYELICTASDRSGNTNNESIHFTVDYTPPIIHGMSEYDGKYLNFFDIPDKIDAYISDMTGVSAECFINGEKITGGRSILDEGKYVLYIRASDEADNYSDKSASFIIDHTAPQIVISGLNKEGYIRKGRNITIGLNDNQDILDKVIFNGSQMPIDEKTNTASFIVDDYGEYDIEVSARDAAGNSCDKIIHTSCNLVQNGTNLELRAMERLIKGEEGLTAQNLKNNSVDIDYAGYIIGLITTLSGTFGLVYCGIKRN